MEGPHILVVTAGLGEPSATALLGDNLAEATCQALETAGLEARFTTISLRSIAKEITNHYLTGFPMGKLAEALDAVRSADAIIAVTPVFKASYSGLFKSFWDLVEDGSLADKPVLIAATGGTARHSLVLDMAMRPLFSYLKATVAPSGVFASTDDFGTDREMSQRYTKAAREFAQLVLWATGNQGAVRLDATPEQEAQDRRARTQEANAGSFFGILDQKRGGDQEETLYKAPGLEALKVTPFEELLRRNKI